MLVKEKELVEDDVHELENLLSRDLNLHQRFLVERELCKLQAPQKGDLCSTHVLNFYFKDSRDWAVIHDLVVKENGFSAQFDHILINRFLEFYVFEAENFSYKVKITPDGEFLVHDGSRYQPIRSPIEENKKQVEVLGNMIIENRILPARLGVSAKPKLKSYILQSPLSEVSRPAESEFDSSMVIAIDALAKLLQKQTRKMKRIFNKLLWLPGIRSKDPLVEVAGKLASMHSRSKTDYREKFSLNDESAALPPASPASDSKLAGDFSI